MKKKQDEVSSEFQKASLAVSEMTNEFSTVSDALEELKVPCWLPRLCSSCVCSCIVRGGPCACLLAPVCLQGQMDSRGSSMTDTSPLMKIKEALSNLRAEVKSMELRIGVVGHTLMQSKLKYVPQCSPSLTLACLTDRCLLLSRVLSQTQAHRPQGQRQPLQCWRGQW